VHCRHCKSKWRIVGASTGVRSSAVALRFVGGIGVDTKLAAYSLGEVLTPLAIGAGFSALGYLTRDKTLENPRQRRARIRKLEALGLEGVPGFDHHPTMADDSTPYHGPRGQGPYNVKRRRTSDTGGSSAPPPARVVVDSHPGTIGITRQSVSRGRKVSSLRRALRLLKSSARSIVLFTKGLNAIDKTDGTNIGFYTLANQKESNTVGLPAGVAQNDQYLPVHIYNLTAVPQGGTLTNGVFQAATSATNPRVGWQLTLDAPAAAADSIGWSGRIGCYDHTGTVVTSSRWGVEQFDDQLGDLALNAVIPPLGKKVYTDWIDARFMLYGKKNWDARYTIMIVKFKDEVYCPEYTSTVALASEGTKYVTSTENGRRAADFWKSYAYGLVNNPVATRPRVEYHKAFDVVYKKRITIAAKDSSETNTNVNMVHFKCFHRVNKLLNHARYQNITAKADGGEDALDYLNETKQNTADGEVNAQPRKLNDNLYLIIQCDGFQAVPDTVDATPATFVTHGASYDLVLRKKVVLDLN